MTAWEYINQWNKALLISTPTQLDEERLDLKKSFKGDKEEFDKAWQQFVRINNGKFRL